MKVTYKYTDKIWKKEVGPCGPIELGRAWFNNRINKDASIFIVELNKSAPLWAIPDFKIVEDVRKRESYKLGIIAAILLPAICLLAWCTATTGGSLPNKEKERRAEEWLANPDNREHFNEYMREQRKNEK